MIDTKPFIKLFKTPLGYYCYDVNTFSMLKITKELYKRLSEKNEFDDKEIKLVIDKLKDKGYLSANRPSIIEHPYSNILSEYLSDNVRKITLQITQNCNLACKYCAYANPIEGNVIAGI